MLVSLASSQKLIDGLNILPRLKQTVLEIYQFAEDVNTFGRLNRALRNVAMLAPLSIAEVRKYRLLETVARFTASKNISEVLVRLGLHKFVSKTIVVDPNLLQGFSRSAYTWRCAAWSNHSYDRHIARKYHSYKLMNMLADVGNSSHSFPFCSWIWWMFPQKLIGSTAILVSSGVYICQYFNYLLLIVTLWPVALLFILK